MHSFRLIPAFILAAILSVACSESNTSGSFSYEITEGDITGHISFLADDSLKGRQAGTPGEARAARYIADHFSDFGLQPAGDDGTFYQHFTVNLSNVKNPPQSDNNNEDADQDLLARNVIGIVEGTENSEEYIVIGAHYDHLGYGAFGSLYDRDTTSVHNGADDNASGTAGLLELAHYFSRQPPAKSIVFVAFSGEEMGLLGSRHFVENSPMSLNATIAMINMDMIGRMEDNQLLIFGTGSAENWESILEEANDQNLNLEFIPDGTGASDHTSFYNEEIPVLHYFTDTHADYHRPSDDTEYINSEGEQVVLQHLVNVIKQLNVVDSEEFAFTEAPETQNRDMTLNGVTLGVTPDYGFEGEGMRITGVRSGGAADRAGLQDGDTITALDGQSIGDIYDYMEILNNLQEGSQVSITVERDGSEESFEVEL